MRTGQTRRTQGVRRDQRKGINFKISRSEIGTYSTAGIDVSNVPAGYLDKFSPEEIEKAKELKAKQWALYNADPTNRKEPEYTDSFYLDYARSLTKEYVLGRMREIHKNRANQYEINDMYWAQYSYEEIIQMENDGYNIPQNVLEWAHAQQQSDVTDYIVLSDSNETDDASSTTDVTASDELSKYRVQSLNDIAKVEKAEQETDEQIQKYRDTEKQAQSLKNQKEDSYKKEFAKINDMTKEWKELNDKKESGGKLSKKEESRLKELSGILNGENGKATTKIEATAAELDEFLQTLDSLNEKIDDNNEIVAQTIQNATDLSDIEKQYRPSALPWVNTGIRIDGNGLSLSTLYGIRVEEISSTAIKKGTDLAKLSDSTINRISSDKTQNVINFATEYTQEANEINKNTKDTMGDKFDEKSPNRDNNQDNYTVLPIFSAGNSVIATATTLMAQADMFSNQKVNDKQSKDLNKQMVKADKEVKDLEQEADASAAEHEKNISQEEQFLMELENLNEEENSKSQSFEQTDSSEEIIEVAAQMQAEDSQDTEETEASDTTEKAQKTSPRKVVKDTIPQNENTQAEDKTEEKKTFVERIFGISEEDNKLASKVGKLAQKGIIANSKGSMLLRAFSDATDNFEASRKTAQKVSSATMAVGIGTVLAGHGHMVEGVALTATGTSILSTPFLDPFTKMYALALIKDGHFLTGMGIAEVLTGTIATGTGVEALATATTAKSVTTASKLTEKLTKKAIEANQAQILASEKAVGIEAQNGTAQMTQGGQQSDSNQANEPSPSIVANQNTPVAEVQPEMTQDTTQVQDINLSSEPVASGDFAEVSLTAQNDELIAVNESAENDEAAATNIPAEDEESVVANQSSNDDDKNTTAVTGAASNIQMSEDGELVSSQVQNSKSDEKTAETESDEKNQTQNQAQTETTEVNENGSVRRTSSLESKTQTEKADEEQKQENENNKADDKSDAGEQKSREAYSVEKDFSIPGSLKAIATTIRASQDVNASKSDARKKESSFLNKMLYIQQINKNIEKNRAMAEATAQTQASKATQTNARIEEENQKIVEASEQGNSDDLEAAQANVASLQAQSVSTSSNDQVNKFLSNVDGMDSAIKNIQKEQSSLKADLNDFNNKINEQLDVSQDTLVVGAGTYGVGVGHKAVGIGLYIGGRALVASAGLNWAQMALGLAMMVDGQILWDFGLAEQWTGLGAAATGSTGLILHSQMKDEKSDVDATEKQGKSFLSITKGGLGRHASDAQEIQQLQAHTTDNVNLVAASASANVDTGNIVETDEKTDKKLLRFNQETEIQSRKKRKKVNAVSSSSRG